MPFEDTTCDPDHEAPQRDVALAWLVPLDGHDRAPVELHLGDTASIGRSRSSTLPIDSGSVSRLHATVTWTGGATVLVVDHGSRNGTEIDGVRVVGSREAAHGAVLRIGPRRIAVLLPTSTIERAGASPESAMTRVRELVRRAAGSDLPVLIVGETGVGKEVLARQLHERSARASGPFVAQSCGAITESLAESVLFGHERGSFTGAHARSLGVFELASGGTLFLDEVGELSPAMQARLLRVIEQREVTRVGAQRPTPTDARLVTATHRDLDAMVEAGTFREDLLYRLDVIRVVVPPLRERPDEIHALAVQLLSEIDPTGTTSLDPSAFAALERHAWPGNVRELRNVLARAVALRTTSVLTATDLALPESDVAAPSGPLRGVVSDTERAAILAALEATAGNRTHAARRLGIARRTLLYKLDRLGIVFPSSRA